MNTVITSINRPASVTGVNMASLEVMLGTYSTRTAEVLKRLYIWHKQKAALALKQKDNKALNRHEATMQLVSDRQRELKAAKA